MLLWSSVQYNVLKECCLSSSLCLFYPQRKIKVFFCRHFESLSGGGITACVGVALQPVWGWQYSLSGGGITACVGVALQLHSSTSLLLILTCSFTPGLFNPEEEFSKNEKKNNSAP